MVNQDNQNNKTIDGFYDDALKIIGNHLQSFYLEYATETGLTLNQVAQRVNAWDRQQFDTAVNELMANVQPDSILDQRLAAAYAQAQASKRDMLNSIITVGMYAATAKADNFGKAELNRQYAEGYNIKKQNDISPSNVPAKIAKQTQFGDRLWAHADAAKSHMQDTLNKALQRGVDKMVIKQLTKMVKHSAERQDNNLASDMNKVLSGVHNLMRDGGIINSNAGYEQAYQDEPHDDYPYAIWHTQEDDRVCDICSPLDGQIWLWEESPEPISDTHDGCRCWRARCDADGNIDPNDDYTNPYA